MGLPLPFRARLVVLTVDRLSAGTFTLAAYGRGPRGQPWVLSRSWAVEGAYGAVETALDVPEGILDGAVVSVSGAAPVFGDAWCALKLRLLEPGANVDAAVLAAGYLTGLNSVGYPAGGRPNSGIVAPTATVVTVANPAAGADWTWTVPTAHRARIYSVVGLLTTSAVAASRAGNLRVLSGATLVAQMGPRSSQTASLAWQYCWGGWATAQVASNLMSVQPFYTDWLLGGMTVGSSTANIDAGDQWSAIALLVGYAPAFGV